MSDKRKILFLMLSCPNLNAGHGGFYGDLALEFHEKGYGVTVVAPALAGRRTGLNSEAGIRVLRVKAMRSSGVRTTLRKGLALTLLPRLYKRAFKRHLKEEKFDLIIMPTPPVTLIDFVEYIKKRNVCAKLYLILRDIHPQSSRSIGMCGNRFVYDFLNRKAQKAYRLADRIGCMSPANMAYVDSITDGVYEDKLSLLPNWIREAPYEEPDTSVREEYGLGGKFVALFGGTVGVGQAVWNIAALAGHYSDDDDIVFLVVGKGVRKKMLEDMAVKGGLGNIRFMDFMPREDYERLMAAADIGIISIDERYTVPTCPSKAIGYMSKKIPVVALVNEGSDFGEFYIDRPGAGFWSAGKDYAKAFADFDALRRDAALRRKMGEAGYDYYMKHFTSRHACERILEQTAQP